MTSGARGRRDADAAVSNVVGAILFVALIFITIATIRVTHVPVWEEEREADHMTLVEGQMAAIKGEADRMADNRTGATVGSPLRLMAGQGSGIFREARLPGSIAFEPGATGGIQFSASEMTILVENGTDLFGVDENWIDFGGSTTIEDVGSVAHLRVRLPTLKADLDTNPQVQGKNVLLSVTDRNGAFAGSFQILAERDTPDVFLHQIVRNASNQIVYRNFISYHQESVPTAYFVNALNDELQFRSVLNAARKPLTLTLLEDGLDGDYTISYAEQQAGGGTILIGGSGRTDTPWATSATGGRLIMEASNNHFPEQTRILEHGALILTQPDGAVFSAPPSWTATKGATRVALDITLPALTGPADSVSKRGTATVTLTTDGSGRLEGAGPDLTITLPTQHGALWTAFWDQMLADAGLDPSMYTTSATASTATLVLTGPAADSTQDISLTLDLGSVRTTLAS